MNYLKKKYDCIEMNLLKWNCMWIEISPPPKMLTSFIGGVFKVNVAKAHVKSLNRQF
jgi:hypothetical protein